MNGEIVCDTGKLNGRSPRCRTVASLLAHGAYENVVDTVEIIPAPGHRRGI